MEFVDTQPTQPTPVPARLHELPMSFVGSGSEYFRIWIVNLLLTLITLGFYYPFAKVRRLRYFHGCTEVGGHAMAFYGDPWKMFRGYVLVLVLFGSYSLAQQISPLVGGFAAIVLALLWPLLWHASMRFRLANTGWRGLRARFTGSRGGAYAAFLPIFGIALLTGAMVGLGVAMGRSAFGALLVIVGAIVPTAGIPWLLWSLKRYQHNHYRFAGEQARFDVTLGAAYGVYLRAALLAFGLGIVLFGLIFAVGWPQRLASRPGVPNLQGAIGLMVVTIVGVIVFNAILRSYLIARLQNLHWRGTGSRHLHFDSQLGARALAWLTARNWLLMVVTLGLYFPFAAVATARMRIEAMTLISSVSPDEFFSAESAQQGSAAGDAAVDALGFDIGL